MDRKIDDRKMRSLDGRSLEPEDEGIGEAWDAELSRRVAEIRDGKVIGKPADQVFMELRRRRK